MFAGFSLTFLSLGSAFFAAIANVLARALLKDLNPASVLTLGFTTMGLTLILLSPLFYFFQATLTSMSILVLVALVDTVANYLYFKTFSKSEASVATPILSLAPAATFLFSWMLLADVVDFSQYFVALSIVVLILLFSVDYRNFSSFKSSTLIPALLASLLFGFSALPSQYLLDHLGVINAPTLYMFRAGFIALFSSLFFPFSFTQVSVSHFRIIFLRGLFVIVQWVLFYTALTMGNAGIVLTLVGVAPIFVFFLSVFFLHEQPSLKKFLASGLILALSAAL